MGENRICPKISEMPKPIDMTIHWKALEEHFLMGITDLGWIYCEGSHQLFKIFTKYSLSLMIFD
jgi:hypothetical protein